MAKTKLERAREKADEAFDIEMKISQLDYAIKTYSKKRGLEQKIIKCDLLLTPEVRLAMTKTMVRQAKVEKKRLEEKLLKIIR